MLAKFINYLMDSGKKTTAQRIVYTALDLVEQKKQRSQSIDLKAGRHFQVLLHFSYMIKTLRRKEKTDQSLKEYRLYPVLILENPFSYKIFFYVSWAYKKLYTIW